MLVGTIVVTGTVVLINHLSDSLDESRAATRSQIALERKKPPAEQQVQKPKPKPRPRETRRAPPAIGPGMTVLDHKDISDAARIIRDGGLVAMPTETVYGLAADATNDKAVARIFEAKGRPQFNPLIIHVAGIEMARRYAEISPLAERLMQAFWPGPLTLVLPRKKDCDLSLLVSAGLDTVGVRMPKHDLAQALIKAVDRPLAAPSANRSGTVSPRESQALRWVDSPELAEVEMLPADAPIVDAVRKRVC